MPHFYDTMIASYLSEKAHSAIRQGFALHSWLEEHYRKQRDPYAQIAEIRIQDGEYTCYDNNGLYLGITLTEEGLQQLNKLRNPVLSQPMPIQADMDSVEMRWSSKAIEDYARADVEMTATLHGLLGTLPTPSANPSNQHLQASEGRPIDDG